MKDIDDHMGEALARAAGSPKVTKRDDLLNNLMHRIDQGGADVADAPAPPQFLTDALTNRTAKRSARIASIGLMGWIAMGIGSAAAATAGIWIALDAQNQAQPQPSVVPTESPAPPVHQPNPLPTSLVIPPETTVDLPIASIEPPIDAVVPPAIPDIVETAQGVIDDLLPDGPLADTIKPVISAISVERINGGLLGALTCAGDLRFSVTATDNVDVTSVSVRITTLGGLSHSIALTKTGATQWSGTLVALAITDLGLLDQLLTVTVEAKDAAGNVATSATNVSLQPGSC